MRSGWIVVVALAACADAGPDESAREAPGVDAGGAGGQAADGGAPLDTAVTPDGADLDQGVDPPDGALPDARVVPDRGPAPDGGAPCELGWPCNPIVIDTFPQSHAGDTRRSPNRAIDRYGCAPDTDESGPEIYYAVDVEVAGTLTVSVLDGDGVDIDVHLLDALDGAACRARDDARISARLDPGRSYVVADTWVDASGRELPGAYTLQFDFRPQGEGGDCALTPVDLRMFWRACDASLDCFERDGERFLRTPARGPVVKEAHLVTVDDGFGQGWPSSAREGLEGHYARSQAATGYVMDRREAWAPAGEGGSEYGQGSTGRKLPVLDEAWYVNMYWRDRPDPGTRMLIRNPASGRAVVASGGYETGPGANTAIGGVTEEIHDYLGTNHRSVLEIGFLADPDLPLGPIECD